MRGGLSGESVGWDGRIPQSVDPVHRLRSREAELGALLGAQRRQDIHLGRWPFSEAKRTDRQYLDPRMGVQRLPEGLTQNSKKILRKSPPARTPLRMHGRGIMVGIANWKVQRSTAHHTFCNCSKSAAITGSCILSLNAMSIRQAGTCRLSLTVRPEL